MFLRHRNLFKKSDTCPICKKKTWLFGEKTYTAERTVDWIHDSTFELIGENSVEVSFRFCLSCFHGILFPKFDTTKLYGKKGPETRKKYFEKYFPKVGYGKRSDSVGICQLFHRTAVDLDRLQGLVQHVEKSEEFRGEITTPIRILDWGGGDGLLTETLGSIISMATSLQCERHIFYVTE